MILRAASNLLFRNLFLGDSQIDIKSDTDASGEVKTEAWPWLRMAFRVMSNPELEDRG